MLQGKLLNGSRSLQVMNLGRSILKGFYAANYLAVSIVQWSDTDLHRYSLSILPLSVYK